VVGGGVRAQPGGQAGQGALRAVGAEGQAVVDERVAGGDGLIEVALVEV
jgi:hypothetical protein